MLPVTISPLGCDDLVLSDFDGTISVIDTSVALMNTLDLAEAWEVEHQWRRGEIDSMECLRRQWALIHRPRAEFFALLDRFPMDPDFPRFVDRVRERGAGLAILSDGLDFYLDHYLEKLGYTVSSDDADLRTPGTLLRFVNHAEVTDDGIELSFPYVQACGQHGNCKRAHLERLRQGFQRVIYLGDGHSDMCVARFADVIFAKDALAEDCQESGRPYLPFANLGDVLRLLP